MVSGCRVAGELPPLPPGFTLDSQQQASSLPPLPAGFTLDQQADQPEAPGFFDRTVAGAGVNFPAATAAAELGAHAATGSIAPVIGGLAGIGTAAGRAMGLTDAEPGDVTRNVSEALTYQPRSAGGQVAAKIGGFTSGLIAKGANKAGEAVTDATGSPALGAATNTTLQTAPALLLRGKAGEVVRDVSRTTPMDRSVARSSSQAEVPAVAERQAGLASVSKDAPTLEKLRTDKNAAYKRAEAAGVQLSEFSFKKLKGKIVQELGERVDPDLHPDTTAAIKRVLGSKGEISLEKLDSLRQIANDAKGAVKPADQRLAAKVVDSIDEYLDGISAKDITNGDPKGIAALKEARDLNTRLKKGEQIGELFRRAEIKAGANYTQSGLENSLRSEFKALALDAKKLKRFTPEERAAITRVAKGAPLENALRFVGKFAPAGPISAAVATFLGGSVLGPSGAAVVGGALGARYAATRMTMRNANAASELVRRGPRNKLGEQKTAAKLNALAE